MPGFSFKSANVSIPPTADIPTDLRPTGRNAGAVQAVLETTKPWKPGEDPIETAETDFRLKLAVVPNRGRTPMWAIHVGHKARVPQLSPFITTGSALYTQLCTLELIGSINAPRLVRAYAGDYTPPLPWQVSAKDAYGGIEYCREFWRAHSYVFANHLIRHESRTRCVPDWYKP